MGCGSGIGIGTAPKYAAKNATEDELWHDKVEVHDTKIRPSIEATSAGSPTNHAQRNSTRSRGPPAVPPNSAVQAEPQSPKQHVQLHEQQQQHQQQPQQQHQHHQQHHQHQQQQQLARRSGPRPASCSERNCIPTDAGDLAYGPCFGPLELDAPILKRVAPAVKVLRRIDHTQSSEIFLAEAVNRKDIVAVKRINKKTTHQSFQMHVNEARVLGRLAQQAHPCILRLFGISDSPAQLDMVIEYCPEGDLRKCCRARTRLNFPQVICDMASALLYMHGEWFAHLDIKPDNVLVCSGRGKLCDFGTATRIGESKLLCGQVGTPGYTAPEVEKGQAFDATLADVWSFGKVTEFVAKHDTSVNSTVIRRAFDDNPSKRPTLARCIDALESLGGIATVAPCMHRATRASQAVAHPTTVAGATKWNGEPPPLPPMSGLLNSRQDFPPLPALPAKGGKWTTGKDVHPVPAMRRRSFNDRCELNENVIEAGLR